MSRVPLKVIGWGPFRLPGESRHWQRSYAAARTMMQHSAAAMARDLSDPPTTTKDPA